MTETALATQKPHALAPAQPQPFTTEQERMIRDSFLSGASNEEAAMLMEIARMRRLNPLLRQIHFVKRYDGMKRCEVWSYQVSIDGLRAIAERTGKYDGQSDPEWDYNKDGQPTKCTIRVYRKDWSEGHHAAGVAFFEEYAQHKRDGGLTQFWATKPRLMLAKCAEALALRKAFPEDMGGLYTAEEMGADAEVDVTPAPRPATPHAAPARPRDLVEDDAARRSAANIAAAAEELQGTIEMAAPPAAGAIHRGLLWKRLTEKRTPKMANDFIEKVCGRKASYSDRSEEELRLIVGQLDKEGIIP